MTSADHTTHSADTQDECPRCGSTPGHRDETCPVCTDIHGQPRVSFAMEHMPTNQ